METGAIGDDREGRLYEELSLDTPGFNQNVPSKEDSRTDHSVKSGSFHSKRVRGNLKYPARSTTYCSTETSYHESILF